ncbi:hypothetical protein MKW98_003387 [Papaver atlanticum]|uniref:ADP,ATP carrier protein n=1 Tax=Papaver atlanticum TaxID=357466 RepID=A0AAD4T8L6_9MAGN|nr:hypothetical protein MKW98_003387 [Papaver atlanticum]
MTNSFSKFLFSPNQGLRRQYGSTQELIAVGVAGAFAKTTIAPLERIKILLQTRTEGLHSIGGYQSMEKLLKREGVFGFYKSCC